MSLEMKYFVLKPKASRDTGEAMLHARASRRAMETYADIIQPIDKELATDLRRWSAEAEEN